MHPPRTRRPGRGRVTPLRAARAGVFVVLGLPAGTVAQDPPDIAVRALPSGLSYRETRTLLETLHPRALPAVETAAGATSWPSGAVIQGLVVDETVSRIGRDFYEVFYGAWESPTGVRSFTVRIQEQPAPGLGTRVVLLIDDEVLGQIQLQPRYDVVEQLALQAAAVVRDEVLRRRPAAPGARSAAPPPEPALHPLPESP
ncbi:CsgE family curli-type amyloid fiber assembly protein [Gaopeijia maritima]|uniref:CsgE family curli-type amyloid fiber assembly protein n=1 Tax=Gaopeijia maritima TaxID=3119007 RepID=UPI00324AAEF4